MIGSAMVYFGLATVLAGLGLLAKPKRKLPAVTRPRALGIAVAGALAATAAALAPAPLRRIEHAESRLDGFSPAWQFQEFHQLTVEAPPERVFQAVKEVTADEISLFRVLTWIRRGGRPLPEGVLNAPDDAPILDVAVRGGFVLLAQDAPRELVLGAVVVRPPGAPPEATPDLFQKRLPPGFVLAAMNFRVEPDGGGSLVSTETRVLATDPASRRRFGAYWRIIYPGSALIRRMWLRAIRERAVSSGQT